MKSLSPMCRILSAAAWLVALAAFATVPSRPAYAADGPALQSIDVQPLANERMRLTLHLSGPAPQPLSFTIDNPARVAIDLPNTSLALPSRRIDVQSGGVNSILAAEGKNRSRLVVSLDKLVPYDVERQGNDIVVTLGTSAAGVSQAQSEMANAQTPSDTGAAAMPVAGLKRSITPRSGCSTTRSTRYSAATWTCSCRRPTARSTTRTYHAIWRPAEPRSSRPSSPRRREGPASVCPPSSG